MDRRDLDGFLHRSWLKSSGVTDQAFRGKPLIGICNSWSELVNCNVHLRGLAESVKRGVLQAGGFPLEFPVMSLGESLMKPTTMLYRNLMAMDVEESIRAYPLDGVVLLTGCDKTNPASILGAASANIPSIVVTGGPMLNGHWRGRELGSCSDCWHYNEEFRAGRITEDEFVEIENSISRSNGHCMTMGTASTMACVTEGLGLTLTGGAAIPAVDSRRTSPRRAGGTRDRRSRRARHQAERHPHPGGVRERDPRPARDLRFDECDPAPGRLCGSRRRRPAAAAVRRPLPHDAVARRPEAGGPFPDGGLLLRRRAAGGDGADRRTAPSGCPHGQRPHRGREHRRCRDREHRRDPPRREPARRGRLARRPTGQPLPGRCSDEDLRGRSRSAPARGSRSRVRGHPRPGRAGRRSRSGLRRDERHGAEKRRPGRRPRHARVGPLADSRRSS